MGGGWVQTGPGDCHCHQHYHCYLLLAVIIIVINSIIAIVNIIGVAFGKAILWRRIVANNVIHPHRHHRCHHRPQHDHQCHLLSYGGGERSLSGVWPRAGDNAGVCPLWCLWLSSWWWLWRSCVMYHDVSVSDLCKDFDDDYCDNDDHYHDNADDDDY